MVKTPSNMVSLKSKAPKFILPDTVSGKQISLSDVSTNNKATLIMFICNHCPFVVHIKDELSKLGMDYKDKDLGIVAISSNDIKNYPEDAPDKMTEFARVNEFVFPYLYDESQEVAKAYNAACTPDFFLYDENLELVYRGQLDSSRPGNSEPVNGADLRAAIDDALAGKDVGIEQRPSMGCNIKWK